MTIIANTNLEGWASPAGPPRGRLRVAMGTLVLAAGTAAEAPILGFPANAQVFVTSAVAGGVAGILAGVYDSVTGVITVLSSNAGDTATVRYLLLTFE